MAEPLPGEHRVFADRYLIEREIGRGGGAVVHLAHDRRLERKVAIKVLLRGGGARMSAERFLREVRIAARLVHPNIVQLFEAGAANGVPYYVMPFVEGETLRELLEREPRLPLHQALRITREIADALNYAHAAMVVHRDIKPENILMADGHPMVADFGIAKAISAASTRTDPTDDQLTTADHAMGTVQYMSPEQQSGEDTLDGRSDIYSLATMLFEMLAGVPPFVGRTIAEVFVKRMTEEPPALGPLRQDVPPALEAAIRCALERDPARRFNTPRDFARALSAAASTEPPTSGSHDAIPSIAVLPFTNTPADPESEYFSDGMTEGVMTALGRLRRMSVVARTSVFAIKGKYEDVREIGRKLNVRWILEGAVSRQGTQLRISVSLVNVSDGFSVWSHTFDREVGDALAMQDEIAQSIADTLRPSLLGGSLPARSTTAPENYRLYLLGRHHWNLRTPPAVDKAEECFREVVTKDPDFALGHAGIADVHHSRYVYGYADPLKSLPLARDAALRAIALDPFAAEPHAALGTVRAVLDWNWVEAAAEFRRAIALDPAYPGSYGWFANYALIPLGRFDEAIAELTRARMVDPLSAHIGVSFGMAYYYSRRYEDAERECRAVLDVAPHFLTAHYFLGRSFVERGRFEEGIACFQMVAKLSGGHPHAPAEIGYAYAKMGDRGRAEQELQLLSEVAKQRFVSSCLAAQIRAALGDVEEALAGFEQGFVEHSTDLLWLGVHPGMEGMRREARFREILKKIGLREG